MSLAMTPFGFITLAWPFPIASCDEHLNCQIGPLKAKAPDTQGNIAISRFSAMGPCPEANRGLVDDITHLSTRNIHDSKLNRGQLS
jgi:hypothetical protein